MNQGITWLYKVTDIIKSTWEILLDELYPGTKIPIMFLLIKGE